MATSLYSHIDALSRKRMPTTYGRALKAVDVEHLKSPRGSALRMGVSCVGEWWFSLLDGYGVRMQGLDEAAWIADYAMLTLTLSGQLQRLGGDGVTAPSGALLLTRWNSPQVFKSADDIRALNIHIPEVELTRLLGDDPPPYNRILSAHSGLGAIVATTAYRLAAESAKEGETDALAGICPELLRMVLKAFGSQSGGKGEYRAAAPPRLARVVEYITEHLDDPRLSPRGVGRACGVSERQLSRDFAAAGRTFSDTLRHARLERAASLLLFAPHRPIAEIARLCGFQTPHHFSTSFHSTYGVCPRAYRRAGTAAPPAPDAGHQGGPGSA